MRDVVIIGGGIIGLSAALALLREGAAVTVIEAGQSGAGATAAAAGMLCPGSELEHEKKSAGSSFRELPISEALFHLGRKSLALWPGFAADLEERSGQDIHFDRPGSLVLATGEKKNALDGLHDRLKTFGTACELLDAAALREAEPGLSEEVTAGLFLAEEGHVTPHLVITALLKAVSQAGGDIREQTKITRLEKKNALVTAALLEDGTRLEADCFVLTAGLAVRDFWAEPGEVPFYAIKGQAFSIVMDNEKKMPRHVLRSSDIYLRPALAGRVVIGATEEPHIETMTTDQAALERLRQSAGRVFPEAAKKNALDHWAGLRPCTTDHAPVIGRSGSLQNLIYAAGHHRNGILLAPVTSELIRQSVFGKDGEALAAPFRPGRFLPYSAG